MRKKYSPSWNKSVQPRKQRKFRAQAPLHTKRKFLSVHLSKDLRKKHNKRNVLVKKGDTVKVLRGQFKGKSGKVEQVSIKDTKVFVAGIEIGKKEGAKVRYGLNPSNVMVTELNLDDKKRQAGLKRGKENVKTP